MASVISEEEQNKLLDVTSNHKVNIVCDWMSGDGDLFPSCLIRGSLNDASIINVYYFYINIHTIYERLHPKRSTSYPKEKKTYLKSH